MNRNRPARGDPRCCSRMHSKRTKKSVTVRRNIVAGWGVRIGGGVRVNAYVRARLPSVRDWNERGVDHGEVGSVIGQWAWAVDMGGGAKATKYGYGDACVYTQLGEVRGMRTPLIIGLVGRKRRRGGDQDRWDERWREDWVANTYLSSAVACSRRWWCMRGSGVVYMYDPDPAEVGEQWADRWTSACRWS
jgi:hypothetical protein